MDRRIGLSVFVLLATAIGYSAGGDMSLVQICEKGKGREDFMSNLFDHLRSVLKSNEPFKMEDDIRQVLRLYDGRLYGLSDFYLRHEPQVACFDDVANVVLVFSFNNTKVHYTWNFAGIKQITGGFWTLADRITAEVQLKAPVNHNKLTNFEVERVRLTELHNMRVQVDGVQPFAWLGTQIGTVGTLMTRDNLKKFLQTNLDIIFKEIFADFEV
ncbi:uncharacterized protein LOC100899989 [Galendromus occidentalis]|uniref:Uncharacterized protein LOC100899989 n=1 Tax=Galendromus occidentalis TaxID=34638 RepID=A0AAJ6QW18_9ACAR|nr:uncharacterized protein LOC100899989 [Galendromus occidentalis]